MAQKAKRQGAKPLKKATRKHERYQRAQRNFRLVAIAGLIEACMKKVQENMDNGALNLQNKALEQQARVLRWTDRYLRDPNTSIGTNSVKSAFDLVRACEHTIDRYMGNKGTISGLGMVWIAMSYIADEARFLARQGEQSQMYNMNTLASTVSTWTNMLLEYVDEDQEEIAGELAEALREIIIREG